MATAIFKTSGVNLGSVVDKSKYALPVRPRLQPGDLILIAETFKSLPRGVAQIRYGMFFLEAVEDLKGESSQLWERPWRYMIHCERQGRLMQPFNIKQLQQSSKEYGRGGTIVYLDTIDERFLEEGGYFRMVNI